MTSISLIVIFSSEENYDFGLVQWFGLLIWILGFIIEVVSDSQKSKFNKKNKGKFINIGLWKYIRHPNYLGEIIIWFGIFVISISYINSIFTSLSILSPIFVFVLLRFLTGVPQLELSSEKKWGNQKEYINYKKEAGTIFPKFK
jgi:steroid 5-alpha reductase family enzyme